MQQGRLIDRCLIAALVACGVAACGGGSGGSRSTDSETDGDVRAATFTSGLEHPWGLAFLADASMLVTERPGRLRHVSADGATVSGPIAGVPAVDARDQGGLFDVALDPDFDSNRRVYLSYAEPGTGADAGRNGTAVARAELSDDNSRLDSVEVIFRQQPKLASNKHFGSRLVFAGDATLLVTLGDRYDWRDEAQDLSNHIGKIVRINTDGSAPADNPYVGESGAAPELYSIGHRNIQGAALHPTTGELWTHEHGPQGGDEVNRTLPGLNYGWPLISYGCEYGAPIGQCSPVGGATEGSGLVQPLSYWIPESIAPSGMVFYTGSLFPQWRGSLFVGALAGQALWRLTLDGNTVSAREALFEGLGERIRDVRMGPDGALYLLTDSDAGRIVRIAN